MPDLVFPNFASSPRIQRAAANAPPMKPGEPDRAAVKTLQAALIQAGFAIADGPTGHYGSQTAAAVQALERRHGLDLDEGVAGHQVIGKLDTLLTGRKPIFIIRAAELRILVQQTETLGGFVHRGYFEKCRSFLDEFGHTLSVTDRRFPHVDFSMELDPGPTSSDVPSVREAAERHTAGSPDVLRVILCRFAQNRFFAATEDALSLKSGVRVRDFILIDVGKHRADNCVLIHEMIHATGLVDHDTDESSVFSVGLNRTVLKSAHAERLGNAFFALPRH